MESMWVKDGEDLPHGKKKIDGRVYVEPGWQGSEPDAKYELKYQWGGGWETFECYSRTKYLLLRDFNGIFHRPISIREMTSDEIKRNNEVFDYDK